MKKSSNHQISYIINTIVEQFNPNKIDFFDIIHRNGNNVERFEFENGNILIIFHAAIDCYDLNDQYEIDDLSITEMEIWDDDTQVKGVTPRLIETTLKDINYNL